MTNEHPLRGGNPVMEWSLSEYNLIVQARVDIPPFTNSSGKALFPADRLFKFTNQHLREKYEDDIARLESLPTLVAGELNDRPMTPAVLVRIGNVVRSGFEIQYEYQHVHSHLFSEEVLSYNYFDVELYDRGFDERYHTHWAIKEGNLFVALFKLIQGQSSKAKPRLFKVPTWPLPVIERNVAVMMPFAKEYSPIYEAIEAACRSQGLRTVRVDNISRPNAIIDDVFSNLASKAGL